LAHEPRDERALATLGHLLDEPGVLAYAQV
jgi:hypothetical protein